MREPSVCAVMITKDRPEMARQAVACFRRQTYDPARRALLIFDSGSSSWYDARRDSENEALMDGTAYRDRTIGELRNMVNALVGYDIIAHWDDDDFSHANRIAEQVALLQSSGADCVGYNEMLFWRQGEQIVLEKRPQWGPHSAEAVTRRASEAWLYSNPNPSYVLGTSMCYWRKAWEARPFEATSQGEDVRWSAGVRCIGVSSRKWKELIPNQQKAESLFFETVTQTDPIKVPRMIARIHGSNTSNAYRPETMARASEWRRVSEWDQHCRSVMA